MEFIDIVNNVLRRLRESTVSVWNQTTYSTMVGDFINDAKSQVEDSWQWSANRITEDVNTSDGVSFYILTSSTHKPVFMSAWNNTQNTELHQRSKAWFDRKLYTGPDNSGTPSNYSVAPPNPAGNTRVQLWPTPDGVYNLKFSITAPQPELTENTSRLEIPSRPVILLATAMLAEEKGETGGTAVARYFEMADKELSNAIALDSALHPLETIWYYD